MSCCSGQFLVRTTTWWLLFFSLPLEKVCGVQQPRDLVANVEADGHLSLHKHKDRNSSSRGELHGAVMRREKDVIEEDAPMGMHLSLPRASSALVQRPAGGLKCNTPIFAPADPCPFECPYLAEDVLYICHFRCLVGVQCGSLDPLALIADDDDHVCRRCKVMGCDDCIPGTKDTCRKCSGGFQADGKGGCFSFGATVMFGIKCFFGFILLTLMLWLLELFTRKRTNWRGLKHGMAYRWRTRIHMPLDTSNEDGVDDSENTDERVHELLLYPLTTNLLRQPICGPGACLHFNYCIAVLVWAAGIIYFYALCACMVSIDMIVLGLTPTKTPQQLCAVIHYGHNAQMDLMYAKAGFALFAYMWTFFGALYFSYLQIHTFHRLDDSTTMKDFVCMVRGLPPMKGSEAGAEEEVRAFIEEKLKQKVIGASICWDYTSKAEQVDQAIELDWKEREAPLAEPLPDESVNPIPRQPKLSFFRRQLRKIDNGPLALFGVELPPDLPDAPPAGADGEAAPAAEEGTAATPLLEEEGGLSESDITAFLNEMESSDCAFLVFDTEQARNDAVAFAKKLEDAGGGVEFKESKLTFEVKYVEPMTARWSGLCYGSNNMHRAKRIFRATWITLLFLFIWCAGFYLPYAYYVSSFSYADGEQPSFVDGQMFSLMVVLGNQIVYFQAEVLSAGADFAFEDEKEVAYNYIYVAACLLNTICDIVLTLWLAYKKMIGMGVHTADDRLLESLTDFTDVFESYPMQKSFGDELYIYSYPACFMYPFILEGVATIALPYFVSKCIVLSHDNLQDRNAELALTYFLPFNLGRYGDVILNVILVTLVFFCPGGFTLPLFLAFLICHFFIYVYDHYRVLRCTPNFYYADSTVDFFAQVQMIFPTACIASCYALRKIQVKNQTATTQISGPATLAIVIFAFLGHSILHYLALAKVMPTFKPEPHEQSHQTYAEIGKISPMTWFNTNPVHCLRSKFIHKHEPACVMAAYGKEHLQKANPALGQHFEDATFGGAYGLAKSLVDEQKEVKMADDAEKKDEKDAKTAAAQDF